jgi:hypothetical protein
MTGGDRSLQLLRPSLGLAAGTETVYALRVLLRQLPGVPKSWQMQMYSLGSAERSTIFAAEPCSHRAMTPAEFYPAVSSLLPVAQLRTAARRNRNRFPKLNVAVHIVQIAESDELSAWRSEHSSSSPVHPRMNSIEFTVSHPFRFLLLLFLPHLPPLEGLGMDLACSNIHK